MERVDFHSHADPLNVDSGKRIVDLAVSGGVTAVAIFAKEQVLPYYDELIDYGKTKRVRVITGAETLTMHMGCGVETVSLGFDHNEMVRINGFNHAADNSAIAKLQIEFLNKLGLEIQPHDEQSRTLLEMILKGKIAEKAIRLCELVVCNPKMHLTVKSIIDRNLDNFSTDLLYRLNLMYHKDENKLKAKLLYMLYFDFGKPGFQFVNKSFQRRHYTMSEHIESVHKAGGVVLYSPEGKFDLDLWNSLLALKIDGVMAFHASKLGFNDSVNDISLDVIKDCVRRKVLVLGGSDYSGRNWKLGTGSEGEMYMSTRRLKDLDKRVEHIRKVYDEIAQKS